MRSQHAHEIAEEVGAHVVRKVHYALERTGQQRHRHIVGLENADVQGKHELERLRLPLLALLEIQRRFGLAHLALNLPDVPIALRLLLAAVHGQSLADLPRISSARLGGRGRAHRSLPHMPTQLAPQPQVHKHIEHVGMHSQVSLADHAVQQHDKLETHFAVSVLPEQLDERVKALLTRIRPCSPREERNHGRQQILAEVEMRRTHQQRTKAAAGDRRDGRRCITHVSFTALEVLAVQAHERLLPLATPCHVATHTLALLSLRQRTNAVAG